MPVGVGCAKLLEVFPPLGLLTEKLSEKDGAVRLSQVSSIEDAVEEFLSKHKDGILLDGLTNLLNKPLAVMAEHDRGL